MTEAEWLACEDPGPILEFLRGRASDRKLRLVACGWCRLAWDYLVDPRSRHAVEVSERYVEGAADESERAAAFRAAYGLGVGRGERTMTAAWRLAMWADSAVDAYPAAWAGAAEACHYGEEENAALAALLRDIFGPLPFRPVPVSPAYLSWNAGTVPRLAQAIYEDRAFDRLPVLADALEEAGCTDPDLLGHLRGPGTHVRGCWAVDVLLGKE